jgi:hypothetical protein
VLAAATRSTLTARTVLTTLTTDALTMLAAAGSAGSARVLLTSSVLLATGMLLSTGVLLAAGVLTATGVLTAARVLTTAGAAGALAVSTRTCSAMLATRAMVLPRGTERHPHARHAGRHVFDRGATLRGAEDLFRFRELTRGEAPPFGPRDTARIGEEPRREIRIRRRAIEDLLQAHDFHPSDRDRTLGTCV